MEQLISVIVPVYNVEKYLDRCIESIVNQTYTNLEIILVDDGSPDNCPAMCDAWAEKDSRIKVIHKENGGLSSARNSGLDVLSGEYLMFVDSDDYIKHDAISFLYNISAKNDASLIVATYNELTDKGVSNRIYSYKSIIFTPDEYWEEFYVNSLHFIDAASYVVSWAKLYKSSVFEKIRFPIGKYHEDEFVIHLITYECSKIVCVDVPIYYYYVNESGIMHSKKNKIKIMDSIESQKERLEFFIKRNNQLLTSYALIGCLIIMIYRYFDAKYYMGDLELAYKIKNDYKCMYKDNVNYLRKRNLKYKKLFLLKSFYYNEYLYRILKKVDGLWKK